MHTRTRGRKACDYAKLNAFGREARRKDELEEGQIQDSPIHVHPSDDELELLQSDAPSVVNSRFDRA